MGTKKKKKKHTSLKTLLNIETDNRCRVKIMTIQFDAFAVEKKLEEIF